MVSVLDSGSSSPRVRVLARVTVLLGKTPFFPTRGINGYRRSVRTIKTKKNWALPLMDKFPM